MNTENRYFLISGEDNHQAITANQVKDINLSKLKEYDNIIIINVKMVGNEKDLLFIQDGMNLETDYIMLVSDNLRECTAIAVKARKITKEILKTLETVENNDLYLFGKELKRRGLYGEAICFYNDIIKMIPPMKIPAEPMTSKRYLEEYCKRFQGVYIYGAGNYGKRCADELQHLQIPIKAFIQTEKSIEKIGNIDVISLSDLAIHEDEAVIVAMKNAFYVQVIPLLVEKKVLNYCIYPFWL